MKKIAVAVLIGLVAYFIHASPIPDYPFVFASGEATMKLAPNTCKVAYEITIRDENPTNGMQMVEERSAETFALLERHGVKKEDVVGFEVKKNLLRAYDQTGRIQFLGYEMTRLLEFTLQELTKYEPIVSVLLKTSDVTRVRTRFDRTDRDEIASRLTAQAVSDARAKAMLMVEAAGQRIVELRAISQHGFYDRSQEFALANREHQGSKMSLGAGTSQTELLFVPSQIEFENRVSIIYEIAEKK